MSPRSILKSPWQPSDALNLSLSSEGGTKKVNPQTMPSQEAAFVGIPRAYTWDVALSPQPPSFQFRPAPWASPRLRGAARETWAPAPGIASVASGPWPRPRRLQLHLIMVTSVFFLLGQRRLLGRNAGAQQLPH